MDSPEQEKYKKRLRAVMKKPENQICSDCTEKRPTWASLVVPPPGSPEGSPPIGAIVCLNCSGSHRRLGVHLSFVRSITLDTWKENEVLALENGGNKIVNMIFEATDDYDEDLKPGDHANLGAREQFIRNKYQHRKYYDSEAFAAYAEGREIIVKERKPRKQLTTQELQARDDEKRRDNKHSTSKNNTSSKKFNGIFETSNGGIQQSSPSNDNVESKLKNMFSKSPNFSSMRGAANFGSKNSYRLNDGIGGGKGDNSKGEKSRNLMSMNASQNLAGLTDKLFFRKKFERFESTRGMDNPSEFSGFKGNENSLFPVVQDLDNSSETDNEMEDVLCKASTGNEPEGDLFKASADKEIEYDFFQISSKTRSNNGDTTPSSPENGLLCMGSSDRNSASADDRVEAREGRNSKKTSSKNSKSENQNSSAHPRKLKPLSKDSDKRRSRTRSGDRQKPRRPVDGTAASSSKNSANNGSRKKTQAKRVDPSPARPKRASRIDHCEEEEDYRERRSGGIDPYNLRNGNTAPHVDPFVSATADSSYRSQRTVDRGRDSSIRSQRRTLDRDASNSFRRKKKNDDVRDRDRSSRNLDLELSNHSRHDDVIRSDPAPRQRRRSIGPEKKNEDSTARPRRSSIGPKEINDDDIRADSSFRKGRRTVGPENRVDSSVKQGRRSTGSEKRTEKKTDDPVNRVADSSVRKGKRSPAPENKKMSRGRSVSVRESRTTGRSGSVPKSGQVKSKKRNSGSLPPSMKRKHNAPPTATVTSNRKANNVAVNPPQ